MSKRSKILAAGLLLSSTLLAFPSVRSFLKHTEPSESVYVAFRNAFGPKYMFARPADVGDGQPASTIVLQDPVGVVEDRDGNLYVSDRGRFVWRIAPNGIATVVAGTGLPGHPRDGVDGRVADLGRPEGMCVSRTGDLYFADSRNHAVMRLAPDGRLWRVAGSMEAGFSGDGEAAPSARLDRPCAVGLDSRGRIYVVDHGNHRIRRIGLDGVITTVAGTGSPGYTGDGGLATEARLNGPYGMFVDSKDNLLIADSKNHVIRRVDGKGVIRTIAGTGKPGYSGDGGPAAAAVFDTPQALFVTDTGDIYIGDEHNHCIRKIDATGTISTVVGNGERGFGGDVVAVKEARLNDPEGVWVRSDGTVLVSDADNGRVRALSPSGTVETLAGSAVTTRYTRIAPHRFLTTAATFCALGVFGVIRRKRRSARRE